MAPSPDETPTWNRLVRGPRRVPGTPLDEKTRRTQGLPATLLPAPAGMDHPLLFDPALKQFPNALRSGEPRFGSGEEELGRAWHWARRTVLDMVLASVAEGPWGGHLVLRGSALMSTWFGRAARDPGDLDFLFTPRDRAMDDPRCAALFETLARDAAAAAERHGAVRIDAAGMVTEEIWTYDRVPGRRMLLPWTADRVPGGTVQLDVVFNEFLPEPAVPTDLRPLGRGPGCRIRAASPGLSLAWKLLWLATDMYPQGKDLYDAVLLAEYTAPSYELLRKALVLSGVEALRPVGTWFLDEMVPARGEWEDFVAEHPWVTGSAEQYHARLVRVLEPLLDAEVAADGAGGYQQWADWLQPLVEYVRATSADDPASALGCLSEGGRDGLMAAVVVVRELAGAERLGLEEALAEVFSCQERWSYWRDRPEACARILAGLG
ncbi:nucleotidyl transferase AbiEii/AbiGii toxin family protein [Streptomyces sp. NPDC092952]|uniref:nucleotidyl transferase AbiEii/AbiGii toxin family protein n=1 Tax=Streptomyces sp. NPDC092952 TaxID=3366018 RepID=UPI00382B771A